MDFFLSNSFELSLLIFSISLSIVTLLFTSFVWIKLYSLETPNNGLLILILSIVLVLFSSLLLFLKITKILHLEISLLEALFVEAFSMIVLYEMIKNPTLIKGLSKWLIVLPIAIGFVIPIFQTNLVFLFLIVSTLVFAYYFVIIYLSNYNFENFINLVVILTLSIVFLSQHYFNSIHFIIPIISIVLSTHNLILMFMIFVDNYKLFRKTEKSISETANKVKLTSFSITNFIDKVKSYKAFQDKIIFSLSNDSKRIYNYFRYFINILSDAETKVHQIKLKFSRHVKSLLTISEEFNQFVSLIYEIKSNQNTFNAKVSDIILKVEEVIKLFRYISERFNSFLVEVKSLSEIISETLKIIDEIELIIQKSLNTVLFFEQISVEGEMISKDYGIDPLWISFNNIRKNSNEIIGKIDYAKKYLSFSVNKCISNLEALGDVEKNMYEILSFLDNIANTLNNLVLEVGKINLDYDYGVEDFNSSIQNIKQQLDNIVHIFSNDKDQIELHFKKIDESIESFISIVSKNSEILKSINVISDLTGIIGQNMNDINIALKEIEKDLNSILE
ncbi:MAG: hypothetical protein N2712_03855 [Brevinematales bacterium]|nr:hypothetical protein [Brevinematales bacterium]